MIRMSTFCIQASDQRRGHEHGDAGDEHGLADHHGAVAADLKQSRHNRLWCKREVQLTGDRYIVVQLSVDPDTGDIGGKMSRRLEPGMVSTHADNKVVGMLAGKPESTAKPPLSLSPGNKI